ncbi:MAG: DUF4332 domain-containing protein [Planctomycetes bacterium]|nr:DUF4332 domain-containing protein [Planctomycetota bacterium]
MSLFWTTVFNSACRSTHHKLAIDALLHLQHPSHELWRNLLLHNYEAYLLGSKAPDDQFKDFKNHVLHVRENFWGGAVTAARSWFERTVMALRSGQWSDAAFAAGVTSHYFTDPHMPLHTGQSEEEGSVHRPAEWSVTCCYDQLRAMIVAANGYPQIQTPPASDWLEQLMRIGATRANAHYEAILDHYSLEKGVRDPQAGLDSDLRSRFAECIGLATIGFARVLDRAFANSAVAPPAVDLTVDSIWALAKTPARYFMRMSESERDRGLVRRIHQEWKTRGKVVENLPPDEKFVRELHARQVLKVPLAQLDAKKARSVGTLHGLLGTVTRSGGSVDSSSRSKIPLRKNRRSPSVPPVMRSTPAVESVSIRSDSGVPSITPPAPSPPSPGIAHRKPERAPDNAARISPPRIEDDKPHEQPLADDVRTRSDGRKRFWERLRNAPRPSWPPWLRLPWRGRDDSKPTPDDRQQNEQQGEEPYERKEGASRAAADDDLVEQQPATDTRRGHDAGRPTRFHLDLDSPIVDAPSIGPRMARRFAAIGVETVSDFLELRAEEAAARLGVKSFDATTLRAWQNQAELVCRIPELRGHDAQLLVEAGVTHPEEIESMTPSELLEQLAAVLETPAAARILRGAAKPDLNEIQQWIACARQARGLRAA